MLGFIFSAHIEATGSDIKGARGGDSKDLEHITVTSSTNNFLLQMNVRSVLPTFNSKMTSSLTANS